MFEHHAIELLAAARLAPSLEVRDLPALHAPGENRILAALPSADYAQLLPHLEPVPLLAGRTIYGAGDQRNYLYFITAGIVGRFYAMENGKTAELGVTGNEGVIGVASVLGGVSALDDAVVVSAGHAWRLRTGTLRNRIDPEGPLFGMLLRYTLAEIAQTGQVAVCARHHTLQQQLARWILSCMDRLPTNELAVTHESIAQMLGVRREGVSEAAAKLQRSGLIQYYRGHISIVDRPRLEAQTCECYAVVKQEYDRLLRPQATAVTTGASMFVHRRRVEVRHAHC
ncbi:MAG: Crp/Fnr family transcriptional regulator [Burkholderiales bacterium]|nr:Crp/Fnr family transcriptional regulator [Burkholderiales bacterium]